MADLDENKTERLSLACTKRELDALAFIQAVHGDRYDGASTVVRDYSLVDAVAFHERARATLSTAAA